MSCREDVKKKGRWRKKPASPTRCCLPLFHLDEEEDRGRRDECRSDDAVLIHVVTILVKLRHLMHNACKCWWVW